MLATAQAVRAGLEQAKPAGAVAVFYDPIVGYSDVRENAGEEKVDWQAVPEKAKMLARYELRQQVRDFIKWLKAQGVV
jgi:hypothetical protein